MPFVFSESNLLKYPPDGAQQQQQQQHLGLVDDSFVQVKSAIIEKYGWTEPPPLPVKRPQAQSTPVVRAQVDINLIRKKKAKIDMKRERKAAKTVSWNFKIE